jgi:DNA-binding beta-propeller fold protein YncE
MDAKVRARIQTVLILFLLLFLGRTASAQAVKIRVSVDGANIKATPEIGGLILANVPLHTVLDAEEKRGEWYKVTWLKEDVKISGFIHEMLVVPTDEKDASSAAGPGGRVRSQAEIVAEIELRMDEGKRLIRQENNPDKALNGLRPLLAKAFLIDDRQKQKQLACEIYLWIGFASAKNNDPYTSLMEFRNMFEVDTAYAKEITRNFSDPTISGFLEHAEKLSRGMIVEYSLEIGTKPKEAVIKIDGKPWGTTPAVYRTTIPKFLLEIEIGGYKPVKEEIFLTQPLTGKEYALETTGRTLSVRSEPKEAKVFLDGSDTGKTTDCELPFVLFGRHTVKIARDNYADWEEQIQVVEGPGPVSLSAVLAAKNYIFSHKWGGPENKFYQMPTGITFDKDGNIYIVDASDTKLKKINAAGIYQSTWGENGKESKSLRAPGGVAVDGQGNVYVTDSKTCSVSKFAKNGRIVKKWGEQGTQPGELLGPAGIAVDRKGDLYVADVRNNRVVKYSAEGLVKKTWGQQGIRSGEFVLPFAVAVNAKDEVIVVDRGRIQFFSLNGEFLSAWGKGGAVDNEIKGTGGVCTDPLNYVYIADSGNNRILKFDPNGKMIGQWGSLGTADGQMINPVAVTVDDTGRVFVAEKDNHRIQVFKIPSK